MPSKKFLVITRNGEISMQDEKPSEGHVVIEVRAALNCVSIETLENHADSIIYYPKGSLI